MKKVSDKKRAEIQAEYPIRVELAKRAQGKCEECYELPDWRGLHPHETVHRSQGGKMSLDNSLMLCGSCHSREHGIRES